MGILRYVGRLIIYQNTSKDEGIEHSEKHGDLGTRELEGLCQLGQSHVGRRLGSSRQLQQRVTNVYSRFTVVVVVVQKAMPVVVDDELKQHDVFGSLQGWVRPVDARSW